MVAKVSTRKNRKKKVLKNLQTVNERSKSFVLFATYVPLSFSSSSSGIYCMWRVLLVHSRFLWIDKLAFATTIPKILHSHTQEREKPKKNANNITFGNSKIKLGKISTERWHNLNIFFVWWWQKPHSFTYIRRWNVNYVFHLVLFFRGVIIIFHYFFRFLFFGCC